MFDSSIILSFPLFFLQSLTSPRKILNTPNRLSPRSAASTPKRSPAVGRKSKLSSPVIGTPDEKPKPQNGLVRRDSFHDIGSDSEMDDPFFNFDSEEMDDEELYAESLLEELKKQQVRRGTNEIINSWLVWRMRESFLFLLHFWDHSKIKLKQNPPGLFWTLIWNLLFEAWRVVPAHNSVVIFSLTFPRKWITSSYNSSRQKRRQEYDWIKPSTNLNTKCRISRRWVTLPRRLIFIQYYRRTLLNPPAKTEE